jgi:formylglycine-generating enzyme required for sulfatase activity
MNKNPPIVLLVILILFGAAACFPARPDTSLSEPAINQDLVLVPAGWFLMGENNARPSNNPQRSVYLNTYYIQIAEVTRAEFAEFIETTGYQKRVWDPESLMKDSELPITNTIWKDANAYCRWLGMRLPTEAEWEKAARGEDGRRYPWGDK